MIDIVSSPKYMISSYFFAYAGQPALRAEAMREAATACNDRAVQATTWETLPVEGQVLIDTIIQGIDGADACVAEISSSNPNVLFEAGYALGSNKPLLLAIDESDADAVKAWKSLDIIETIGRINYGGNSQRLADALAKISTESNPPLLESLLASSKPREPNAIFAPGVPHKHNSAQRLERLLERRTNLKLLAAHDELGFGSLSYYVQEIYRSSAVILHFMKPTRLRAAEYNSRLALLAGIAKGLKLPLLMVAEEGYETPLDYKDLMFTYKSAAKLTDHVDGWLESLPTPKNSNKRLGMLKLDIELPLRTFGQYVAESERDSLTDYFVHTNEFEAVLSGRTGVFAGRKGTGKTASMLQASEELSKDRRMLVVPIKPSSYDLRSLIAILDKFSDPGNRDYFLISLWSYLLVSEIAINAVIHVENRPAGLGANSDISDLVALLSDLDIDVESDLSSRLDDTIMSALAVPGEGDLRQLAESLRSRWHGRLLGPLKRVLHEYDRVAVLVDNLDKTWERGVDYEQLSQFLLALLVTSGRLQSEMSRSKSGVPQANLTLTIFLRTDIYDVMTTFAREPDKISPQSIQWDDEELLIRVLEDRYLANRNSKNIGPEALWEEVFDAEVHGMATRDYFLWRALPRPRDIIFLGNSALTTAINRRHDMVLAQDFVHAENLYSRFAVEALLVESEAQGFELEELLFEFAGLDSTLVESDLADVLEGVEDAVAVKDWLIRTSFLGLETRDGSFVHVEGESEARKKFRAAERLALRLKRALRYRVHPAFRPYLDIRDDDVHA